MKRPLPLTLIEDAFTLTAIALVFILWTGGFDQMLGL